MIHCPNCGTSNRKGSRFCSECGESLPSTGTRCPMCGTVNPVGNVYCSNCTARLVPLTGGPEEGKEKEEGQPIQGISLPTIPLDDEGEGDEEGAQPSEREPAGDDWLGELRESADETDEEPIEADESVDADAGAPEPADIPEWLHDMGPVGEEPRVSREAEARFEDGEAKEERPSAIEQQEEQRDARPQQDEPSEPEPPSEPEGEASAEAAEVPAWLSDLEDVREEISAESREEEPRRAEESPREPGAQEGEEAPPDTRPPEEEIPAEGLRAEEPRLERLPDWLREAVPPTAGEEPAGVDEAESAAIEIPDWLAEAPTEETERGPDEATPEGDRAEDAPRTAAEMPDWALEPESRPDETVSGEQPVGASEAAAERFEPPDWLRELMEEPQTEEETFPPPIDVLLEGDETSEGPERAEIPSWLEELRPSEEELAESTGGLAETEGLLQGLQGVIPVSSTIEAPPSFQMRPVAESSEASRARAELLQSLLGEPVSAGKPQVEKSRPDTWRMVERWAVAVVLLATVLGMLLAPLVVNEAPRLTQPVADAKASQLFEIVDGLDSTADVLVAFDYGPPEADELNLVAKPVLKHVVDSGAHVSIVTTRPDGLPVATALMEESADSSDFYTLVGYQPGGATAVSQLLPAADSPPALLLIVTSRPGSLRRWVEQAHARYGDRLNMAAINSALLEPVTDAYLDANAGQVDAAVHGWKGAATYEALLKADGEAARKLDTLAAGQIAIVAMMLVGAAVHGLGRIGERR